ncbi:MAG: response regulator transcription factor [Pseudoclavibacter sp.]
MRTAAAGADVPSPEATRRLLRLAIEREPRDEDSRVAALPGREREVLRLVGEGRSNAETGRALYLAESTVKGHVSRLMDKLDCDNRTKLALMAPKSA